MSPRSGGVQRSAIRLEYRPSLNRLPLGKTLSIRAWLSCRCASCADTAFILGAAVAGLRVIYRRGFNLAQAGVMLLELQDLGDQPRGARPRRRRTITRPRAADAGAGRRQRPPRRRHP